MSDEDQKLMEKISALAGQINRHKNQQAGLLPTPSPTYGPSRRRFPSPSTQSLPREPSTDEKRDASAHARGGHYRGHHPYSTRGGYRVGKAPAHRHRTLVLNGTSGVNTVASDAAPASDASSPSWVTKNDRHLQLINSSVYQEQAEARNKAIEQTRLRKLQHKENRERSQFMSHLRQTANPSLAYTNPTSAPVYEIVVDGVKFAVVKGGSKLVKLPGNPTAPETTPRVALVGGVKFRRTKNGNMYREAAVKAQRRSGAVNKVNVPCKNFSNTGSCSKGPMCRYTHDHAKVAACKTYLQKGTCAYRDECDLSHELTPERTPHCVHYAKGNCSKPDCPYTHRVLSPGASVCRDFGFYGYCDKGISCPDRHSFECPDFSNNGVCKTKGCKLPHIERANVLRKASAARQQAAAAADGSDDDDLSSDDGESVGSDEVDSDEVDEFVGEDGSVDFEQQDFISL